MIDYTARPPITRLRVDRLGGHDHIGVWINHAKAGELVLRADETPEFLYLLGASKLDGSLCLPQ